MAYKDLDNWYSTYPPPIINSSSLLAQDFWYGSFPSLVQVGTEVSGGTSYSQSLSASMSSLSASTYKTSTKPTAATIQTLSAAISKLSSRSLSASPSQPSAAVLRSLSRSLSSTMSTLSAILPKLTSKSFNAT